VRDITQRIQQEDSIARLTRLYAVLSGVNSAIVRYRSNLLRNHRITTERRIQGRYVGSLNPDTNEMEIVASSVWQKAAIPAGSDDACRDGSTGQSDQGESSHGTMISPPGPMPDTCGRTPLPWCARRGSLTVRPRRPVQAVVCSGAPGAFGDDGVHLLRELAGNVSLRSITRQPDR
jgi:hypothetical protein